jgi:hypothetical protein
LYTAGIQTISLLGSPGLRSGLSAGLNIISFAKANISKRNTSSSPFQFYFSTWPRAYGINYSEVVGYNTLVECISCTCSAAAASARNIACKPIAHSRRISFERKRHGIPVWTTRSLHAIIPVGLCCKHFVASYPSIIPCYRSVRSCCVVWPPFYCVVWPPFN